MRNLGKTLWLWILFWNNLIVQFNGILGASLFCFFGRGLSSTWSRVFNYFLSPKWEDNDHWIKWMIIVFENNNFEVILVLAEILKGIFVILNLLLCPKKLTIWSVFSRRRFRCMARLDQIKIEWVMVVSSCNYFIAVLKLKYSSRDIIEIVFLWKEENVWKIDLCIGMKILVSGVVF
jgi:hypothetical protein